MTKKEMMEIVERYEMEEVCDPITREFKGYTVRTEELIPELDKYADSSEYEIPAVTRTLDNKYTYSIYVPSSWI